MSDFDKWFRTTMLPAECDDERVIVGMRLCWDAAMLHAAEVAKAAKPSTKDLSREEWIAVDITHEKVVQAIYNGLSN